MTKPELPLLSMEEIQYELDHQWDTQQDSLRAGTISLIVAAVFSVVLRLYARRIQGMTLRWNDYMVVIALVLTLAMCGVILRAIDLGFGLHIVIVGTKKGMETAKMLYVAEVLFPAANSTARISALLLYHAIFGSNCARWFRIGLRVLGTLFVLLATTGTFCLILQCVPIHYSWETNHKVQCLDLTKFMFAMTLISVVLNIATLALPMPLIWNLRMTIRRKLAIGALFTLAGADVVINILRAAHTQSISTQRIDFTFPGLQCTPTILGVAELCLGIICVCIPTLRPIFTRISNAMARQSKKAGINDTSWTVPFVLLKTKTGGHVGALRPYNDSLSTEYFDEEKSLERSLPPYSDVPRPEETAKRPGRLSMLKTSLFRKSRGTTLRSGSIPVGFAPDGSIRDSGTQMSIEPLIAHNLLQSGYKKAFHPPESPQFEKPVMHIDQSPPPTPQQSRATSHKSRITLKSLYSRKSEETPRPPSRGKRTDTSPFSDHSSPTLLGEDDSRDIHPPMPDLNATLSKAANDGLGIYTDPPLLRPNRYIPPAKGQQKVATSKSGPPARNKSEKSTKSTKSTKSGASTKTRSKSPRYVKSPLMDPNDKVRTGSPREITIKTPVRGRSVKDPNKTLKSAQSNSSLRREPTIPNIEPDVVMPQRRYLPAKDGYSPIRESALPRSLEWRRKDSREEVVETPKDTTKGGADADGKLQVPPNPRKGPRTPPELERMVQDVARFGRGELPPSSAEKKAEQKSRQGRDREREPMKKQEVDRWRQGVGVGVGSSANDQGHGLDESYEQGRGEGGQDGSGGSAGRDQRDKGQERHENEREREREERQREHWHVERAPTTGKRKAVKPKQRSPPGEGMNKEEKPLPPLPLRRSGGWI